MPDPTRERWLPIPGYPNYEVSDLGRVYSRPRNGTKGGILKPVWQGGKYLVVSLWRDRNYKTIRLHTLVLEAFTGPPPGGAHGRHLNGNPADNALGNLVWGTPSENAQDSVRHGTQRNTRKTHCPAGHEYTPTNTRIAATGWRQCRQCDAERQAARRSARR